MQLAKTLVVYKPVSFTPLQILTAIKDRYEIYAKVKLAYAGRLDPMAEGIMVVLVGEECKKRDIYQKLPKQYEFQAVFGIETDSYDTLGLITDTKLDHVPVDLYKLLSTHELLRPGKHIQILPPFSGGVYKGTKLFELAKRGNLNKSKLPLKNIEIFSSKIEKPNSLSASDLHSYIINHVSKVQGDFRQTEIVDGWNQFFINNKLHQFQTITIKINCSSGTYIRSLINQLGENLGCKAMAIKIKRTKVGKFTLKDCITIV